MPLDPATREYINRRVGKGRQASGKAIAVSKAELIEFLLDHLHRHDEFTLTNIAANATVEQDVSWQVPIAGNYTVVVAPTTGAAVVGFVSATVKATTKTPTGCTVIVANRSGNTVATAAFDVLAFPI